MSNPLSSYRKTLDRQRGLSLRPSDFIQQNRFGHTLVINGEPTSAAIEKAKDTENANTRKLFEIMHRQPDFKNGDNHIIHYFREANKAIEESNIAKLKEIASKAPIETEFFLHKSEDEDLGKYFEGPYGDTWDENLVNALTRGVLDGKLETDQFSEILAILKNNPENQSSNINLYNKDETGFRMENPLMIVAKSAADKMFKLLSNNQPLSGINLSKEMNLLNVFEESDFSRNSKNSNEIQAIDLIDNVLRTYSIDESNLPEQIKRLTEALSPKPWWGILQILINQSLMEANMEKLSKNIIQEMSPFEIFSNREFDSGDDSIENNPLLILAYYYIGGELHEDEFDFLLNEIVSERLLPNFDSLVTKDSDKNYEFYKKESITTLEAVKNYIGNRSDIMESDYSPRQNQFVEKLKKKIEYLKAIDIDAVAKKSIEYIEE